MKITRLIVKTTDGYLSEYFPLPVFTSNRSEAIALTAKQWAKVRDVYATSPSVAHLLPFNYEAK